MYESRFWGNLPDGRSADIITLTSSAGAVAEISNFGGIIRSLTIPLPDGTHRQTVLNYDTPAEYAADSAYIGATVGPVLNRIRNAAFTLDGTLYQLEKNEGENSLHSGSTGWHNVIFDYSQQGETLLLKYHRPDGEGGFPGNVDVTIRFLWQTPTTLAIAYHAVTDRPTILNMGNHSYFNLGLEDSILTHSLRMHADFYTPVDEALLPTGEIAPVAGTGFDFNSPRPIGQHYDHNFVLAGSCGCDCGSHSSGAAITLEAPDGKLLMDVFTNKPGVQLYTGTHLKPPFAPYGGLCLETQIFPDAANIPTFPSPVVRPGKPYLFLTAFAFKTP